MPHGTVCCTGMSVCHTTIRALLIYLYIWVGMNRVRLGCDRVKSSIELQAQCGRRADAFLRIADSVGVAWTISVLAALENRTNNDHAMCVINRCCEASAARAMQDKVASGCVKLSAQLCCESRDETRHQQGGDGHRDQVDGPGMVAATHDVQCPDWFCLDVRAGACSGLRRAAYLGDSRCTTARSPAPTQDITFMALTIAMPVATAVALITATAVITPASGFAERWPSRRRVRGWSPSQGRSRTKFGGTGDENRQLRLPRRYRSGPSRPGV
ncbi:hypothetical protein SAMN05443248_8376 [Bradyrhizobium erythrophlei]|uniref:Uncharacterized protein n=1 Tax=Bradyrhizobium erythrophlei TaxID=1437360 RepID=A0A1M5YK71_9BRAD|nr:hypothetical protein SAMN05443248_8376 [Bradyrhizobium erythrophlei]